jgi:hypothetical protein
MPYKDSSDLHAAQRRWYQRNKKKIIDKQRDARAAVRKQFKDYKSTLKCSRCPENHPATLDFHHKDPTQKDVAVSKAINRHWNFNQILAEVKKCEILCANCHRKEHFHE